MEKYIFRINSRVPLKSVKELHKTAHQNEIAIMRKYFLDKTNLLPKNLW